MLTCTDPATDVGDIVEDNGFGWQCTSDKIENFVRLVEHIANSVSYTHLTLPTNREV